MYDQKRHVRDFWNQSLSLRSSAWCETRRSQRALSNEHSLILLVAVGVCAVRSRLFEVWDFTFVVGGVTWSRVLLHLGCSSHPELNPTNITIPIQKDLTWAQTNNRTEHAIQRRHLGNQSYHVAIIWFAISDISIRFHVQAALSSFLYSLFTLQYDQFLSNSVWTFIM